MYMAEGGKTMRNTAVVTNTDPIVIRMAYRFLCFLSKRKVSLRLFCRKSEEQKLRLFWSNALSVTQSELSITFKDGAAGNRRSEYGVVQVRTNDTYLMSKLMAWMDWLKQEWEKSS
jgi:hypothetical protein